MNDDGTLAPQGRAAAAAAADAATRNAAAAPARSEEERHLAIRRRRQDVAVRVERMAIARCTTARSASIPTNPEIAYQGGAPFFKTVDGGKTWRQVQGIPHSDHHAIWIDPKNSNHLLLGNDGGLDVTYDQAETWEYVNTVAGRPVLRGQRRHAEALLRLRRAAGQRELVRPERDAQRRTAS